MAATRAIRSALAVLAALTVAPSHALEPGQVVEVPAVCRSADAARGYGERPDATAGGCLVVARLEVPAYLLAHVTGPHGTAARWWSIWRARVGKATGFVVVRDWAL